MIPSKGDNHFKDNIFDFWTWSAPVLQTAEEVVAAVREQKLIGRVIKDIRAVGHGYYLNCDWFCDIIEAICKKDDKALDSMDFPCSIEIDEPLLILFEDGDILGIDYSDGSSLRMEMNTLPWEILPGVNCRNFHANRLFRDLLGCRIDNVVIAAAMHGPFFTGSHGMTLAEQPSYLHSLSFICHEYGQNGKIQNEFKFEPDFDYGCVSLESESVPARLPAARLRDVLEGFMSPEDMKKYL